MANSSIILDSFSYFLATAVSVLRELSGYEVLSEL